MDQSRQDVHLSAGVSNDDASRRCDTKWHSYRYFLERKLSKDFRLSPPTIVRTEESSHLVSMASTDADSFQWVRIQLNNWCEGSRVPMEEQKVGSDAGHGLCSHCSRKYEELQTAIATWPKSLSHVECNLISGFACRDHSRPTPAIEISHKVWLPAALALPEIMVVFPRVGLANRLFLYSFSRLAAMLLRKSFYLATEIRELKAWPPKIDYTSKKIESREVSVVNSEYEDLYLSSDELSNMTPFLPLLSTHLVFHSQSSKPCPPECSISLLDVLIYQADIGRLYVQALHSGHIASSMILRFAPVVSAWMVDLANTAVAESRRALPFAAPPTMSNESTSTDSLSSDKRGDALPRTEGNGADASDSPIDTAPRSVTFSENDWIIHIRTGDIWIEDPKDDVALPNSPNDSRPSNKDRPRGRINSAYCPPPCWWYKEIAKEEKMENVWLVSASRTSTLTRNVALALLEGGVKKINFVQGSQRSDFGLLMRARNFVCSCSSFAWWAGFLTQVVTLPDSVVSISPASEDDETVVRKLLFPLTGLSNPVSFHATYHDLSFQRHRASQRWFKQKYYTSYLPYTPNMKHPLLLASPQEDTQSVSPWVQVKYPLVSLSVSSAVVWHPRTDAMTLQHYASSPTHRKLILSRITPDWYQAGEFVPRPGPLHSNSHGDKRSSDAERESRKRTHYLSDDSNSSRRRYD